MSRIRTLAADQRYEEAAAALRDLEATLRAIDSHQQRSLLGGLGEVVAAARREAGWDIHVIRHGRLAGAAHAGPEDDPRAVAAAALACAEFVPAPPAGGSAALTAETDLVLAWMAHGARLVQLDPESVWALPSDCAARDRHTLTRSQGRVASREDSAAQRSSTSRAAPDAMDSAATGKARRILAASGAAVGP
jgi:DNA polymerase-3 subunit epsilon